MPVIIDLNAAGVFRDAYAAAYDALDALDHLIRVAGPGATPEDVGEALVGLRAAASLAEGYLPLADTWSQAKPGTRAEVLPGHIFRSHHEAAVRAAVGVAWRSWNVVAADDRGELNRRIGWFDGFRTDDLRRQDAAHVRRRLNVDRVTEDVDPAPGRPWKMHSRHDGAEYRRLWWLATDEDVIDEFLRRHAASIAPFVLAMLHAPGGSAFGEFCRAMADEQAECERERRATRSATADGAYSIFRRSAVWQTVFALDARTWRNWKNNQLAPYIAPDHQNGRYRIARRCPHLPPDYSDDTDYKPAPSERRGKKRKHTE